MKPQMKTYRLLRVFQKGFTFEAYAEKLRAYMTEQKIDLSSITEEELVLIRLRFDHISNLIIENEIQTLLP